MRSYVATSSRSLEGDRPMREQKRRTDRSVLRDCWSRWTEILSLFVRRHPARHRVDPRTYAAMRDELIASCRLCAVRARLLAGADCPEAAFYAGLVEKVQPWLDLHVLERTDREILASLLRHCRDMEHQLRGKEWRPDPPHRWWPTVAIIGGGAVIFAMVCLVATVADLLMVGVVRDTADALWLTINLVDSSTKWVVIAVITVLTAICIVSRSVRTRG
jgi:hypothetical protein